MRIAHTGFIAVLTFSGLWLHAQTPSAGFGTCKPVAERKTDIGCWILAEQSVGRFDRADVYWHLDAYPTRTAAEQAKTAHGVVVEALGKTWLMTIADKGWRPARPGKRAAEIGPLHIRAGKEYSTTLMEAILEPGMTSAVHRHSGPEAWYTTAGQTCLETPQGKMVGDTSHSIVVPEGPPMFLVATGATTRRAITLILHDASQPPTTMEHEWKPKGLCR